VARKEMIYISVFSSIWEKHPTSKYVIALVLMGSLSVFLIMNDHVPRIVSGHISQATYSRSRADLVVITIVFLISFLIASYFKKDSENTTLKQSLTNYGKSIDSLNKNLSDALTELTEYKSSLKERALPTLRIGEHVSNHATTKTTYFDPMNQKD
jgi:hypothetical protein